MGTHRATTSDFQPNWRWSLIMGTGISIFSLMLGLLFQTLFYEITRNIPSIIRQDAHISLPLCGIFPTLYGCEAWVGSFTALEIWELSLKVGWISGLLVNPILMVIISARITAQARDEKTTLTGLLTGMFGLLFSLMIALVFNVPLSIFSPLGIFAILLLSILPLSGWLGGRIGTNRHRRRLSQQAVYFLPRDGVIQTDWGGERLSLRELEVLALVAEGLSNRDIAQRLCISKATVKTHLIHIFTKLRVKNRTSAVTQALAYGLIQKKEKQDKLIIE